jgi:hypothetical protein
MTLHAFQNSSTVIVTGENLNYRDDVDDIIQETANILVFQLFPLQYDDVDDDY